MKFSADATGIATSAPRSATGPVASPELRRMKALWTHGNMSPRERVFSTLWNRYVDEECRVSDWSERHMRDKLELFVYMYRHEILMMRGEASMRLELFSFLRLLHTHGHVNSMDVNSVMRCLDGTLPTAARNYERQCGVTDSGSLPVVKVYLDGERMDEDGATSGQSLDRGSNPVASGEEETSSTNGAGGMWVMIVNDEDQVEVRAGAGT